MAQCQTKEPWIPGRLGLVFWCVFGTGLSIAHASPSSFPRGYRVVAVRFQGSQFQEAEAQKYVEIRPGDRYSLSAVRRSVKLLYHLGLFGQVRVEAIPKDSGVELVFHLVPMRRVLGVEFTGHDVLSSAQLRRLARIVRGDEFDRWKIESAIVEMKKRYHSLGYRRVEILSSAKGPPDGDVAVQYFIREGTPTRISEIRITGNPVYKQSTLEEIMRLRVGRVLDVKNLESAIERLKKFYQKEGYWEVKLLPFSVDPTSDTLWEAVHLEIEAGQKVQFHFRGNRLISKQECWSMVKPEGEVKFTEQRLDDLCRKIERRYFELGHAEASVRLQTIQDPVAGTKHLIFLVDEGPRVKIERIWFEGNRAFDGQELQEVVEAELAQHLEHSLVGRLTDRGDLDPYGGGNPLEPLPRPVLRPEGFFLDRLPETMYVPEAMELALERIKDLYRSHGFLSIEIDPLLLSYNELRTKLYLTINIREGAQTKVESIIFEGNQVFSSGELFDVAAQVEKQPMPGSPLNLVAVDDLGRSFVRKYAELGYHYCRVKHRLVYSDDQTLAQVHFQFDEGPQVRVRHILVRGAVLTKPSVFERTLVFKTGDVFSRSKVSESQAALTALRIFNRAEIRMVDADIPEPEKDVLVMVRERLPNELDFGPGLSSGEGVSFKLDYTRRNLWGSALEFVSHMRVNYQVFYPEIDTIRDAYESMTFFEGLEFWVSGGLRLPHVWFVSQSVAARIDLVGKRDHAISYDLDKVSLVPGIDWKIGQDVTLTLESELEYDALDCTLGQECGQVTGQLRLEEGQLLLASLRPRLTWDGADDIMRPRRGLRTSLSLDVAKNLLPNREVQYFKLDGSITGYLPLAKWLTLALHLQAGVIFQLSADSRTPSHKMFYLGGVNTVRGFEEDSIIPVGQVNPHDPTTPCVSTETPNGATRCVSLGANALLNLKTEFRFPLFANGIDGAIFCDMGNLWVAPKAINPFQLKPTAGFGIRYDSPIGAIGFDFGFNLKPDASRQEGHMNWHFIVGVF